MRSVLPLISCLVCLAPSVHAEGGTQGPELTQEQRKQRAAEAADLFSEGKAAFENDDLSTALDRLTRSHALWPDHRNAALLGQIELTLGDAVAAATHLDESVRRFPHDAGGAGLEMVMAGLRDARQQVGTLRVHSQTPGAKLWIDGTEVGALPLERDLYVAPGAHRLEVRAPGHAARLREETINMGGSRHVELTLAPLDERVDDRAQTPSDAFDAADATLITGGALTLLGLGAGIGLELWARDSEARVAELRRSECGAATAANCFELREQSDSAAARHDLSTLSFVVSSAVGVLTLGTFAILRSSDDTMGEARTLDQTSQKPTLVELKAWLSPESAGVGLSGGF